MTVKDIVLRFSLRCGLRPNVVCAKKKTGRICVGDSGGPLVADRDGDGRWVIYGVTSFQSGRHCTDIFAGNGFSDVAAWTDTIIGVVNANP